MTSLARAIVFVKDVKQMTAFYRDGVGLTVVTESPGWVELGSGASTLALHAIPKHIADRIVIASPPTPREDSAIKLAFEVADLAQAKAQLENHGAVMGKPNSFGFCDGVDPEGNVFQVVLPR